jgi:hypothetical protein
LDQYVDFGPPSLALQPELFHFGEKALSLRGGTLNQEMKRWGKKRLGKTFDDEKQGNQSVERIVPHKAWYYWVNSGSACSFALRSVK